MVVAVVVCTAQAIKSPYLTTETAEQPPADLSAPTTAAWSDAAVQDKPLATVPVVLPTSTDASDDDNNQILPA